MERQPVVVTSSTRSKDLNIVGERTVVLSAGGFVYIPAGTVHGFRFRANGGKFVSFNSGAGAAKLFRELDHALPDGRIELDKFVPIAIANRVTLAR